MKKFFYLSIVLLLIGYSLRAQKPKDSTIVIASGQDAELAYNKALEFYSQNQYDSAIIKNTSGVFMPGKFMFVGKGGRFDWSVAGLEQNKIYAELDAFSIPVRSPGFKADAVKLHAAGILEKPAEGIFEFKSLKHDRPEDATYPRFMSYDRYNKIFIEGSENFKFIGGFALMGPKRTTACLSGEKSELKVSDARGRKFRVTARKFDLGDSLITARHAYISIYQGNDSITHPSVKFRYYLHDHELVAVKELDGFKIRPFNSSYYQMSINADLLQWDIRTDSMNISVMNAKSMLPAYFKSTEYYDERERENRITRTCSLDQRWRVNTQIRSLLKIPHT